MADKQLTRIEDGLKKDENAISPGLSVVNVGSKSMSNSRDKSRRNFTAKGVCLPKVIWSL